MNIADRKREGLYVLINTDTDKKQSKAALMPHAEVIELNYAYALNGSPMRYRKCNRNGTEI